MCHPSEVKAIYYVHNIPHEMSTNLITCAGAWACTSACDHQSFLTALGLIFPDGDIFPILFMHAMSIIFTVPSCIISAIDSITQVFEMLKTYTCTGSKQ